jgi:hypothetical protein
VEIFLFGRSLFRTSTLVGQGTFGCQIRFPESLLMLKPTHRIAETSYQFFPKRRPKYSPRRFVGNGRNEAGTFTSGGVSIVTCPRKEAGILDYLAESTPACLKLPLQRIGAALSTGFSRT